jgi:hypothetical protein
LLCWGFAAGDDPVQLRKIGIAIERGFAVGRAGARAYADEGMNGSGRLLDLGAVRDASFSTSRSGKAIKVCNWRRPINVLDLFSSSCHIETLPESARSTGGGGNPA